MDKTFNFVSIILAVRNEKPHIKQCLDSLLRQTYSIKQYEILVIDGMSTDGSQEIIKFYQNQHPRVKYFNNPRKIKPAGLNIGLKNARGGIMIIFDGHAQAYNDFIAQSVACLKKTDAVCVGGPIVTQGTNYLSQAIALALSSRFGSGGAKFRSSPNYEGYTDTVAFGAYRRTIFNQVGFFNTKRIRTEDLDLHYRIKKAGGKFFITPKIKSVYFCRSNLISLAQQAWQNGQEIMSIIYGLSWRHLAPLFFVLSVLASLISAFFFDIGLKLLILILGAYTLTNLFFSLWLGLKHHPKYLPALPIIFAVLHLSYGLGSLTGITKIRFKPQHV